MMRTMIISLALTWLCGAAYAQSPARVLLCADEARTQCAIVNTVQEIVTIHMFLVSENGGTHANTVDFYAPTPVCWEGAVFLGDEINDEYLHLGGTHDAVYGLTVTFRGCKELPLRIGSMSFWSSGSDPCCFYDLQKVPSDLFDFIEVIDCQSGVHEAPYTSVTINPDKDCPTCAPPEVATEPTTWGRVKAFYQ